jgi:HEAT repeat protein
MILASRSQHSGCSAGLGVCIALGHLKDSRAISCLIGLRKHPNRGVRFGVMFGLLGHQTPEAIEALIALSSDSDEHVRDWSTFGLGQMIDVDTPAIRAALRARLDDPCLNARGEAIEALATRRDLSVIPALIQELKSGVSLPLLNAAITLARPELCEALAAADVSLVVETSLGPGKLGGKRCGPAAAERSSASWSFRAAG